LVVALAYLPALFASANATLEIVINAAEVLINRHTLQLFRRYTRCAVTVSTAKPEGGARCVSNARRDLVAGVVASGGPAKMRGRGPER
jgi:hypothetical protein